MQNLQEGQLWKSRPNLKFLSLYTKLIHSPVQTRGREGTSHFSDQTQDKKYGILVKFDRAWKLLSASRGKPSRNNFVKNCIIYLHAARENVCLTSFLCFPSFFLPE